MTKKILFAAFVLFLLFAFLNPNPFGNNPDSIADESYFLSSSLSAIEKHTLPGWEFGTSGNYYGGPQTYLDTLVLVPVIGIIAASQGFSMLSTKMWVAQNSGELLHILRVVNGLFALSAIAFCFMFFRRRKIPPELALTLTLFLFLLLSNVLFLQLVHSAKVWVFYAVFVSVISAFFIVQEYYFSNFEKPFFQKEIYLALLVWGAVLVSFQSIVGAFSILLFIFYALLLRHFTFQELSRYIMKRWYWFLLFTLTQISFIYRAVYINLRSGSFFGISLHTANGEIDWPARFLNPLIWAWECHPLAVISYIVGVLAVIFLFSQKISSRKRVYLAIAIIHPILTYVIFHLVIGFSLAPRYAIMLTLALAFSGTILLYEADRRLVKLMIALSLSVFAVIGIKAMTLYWQPSSEKVITQTILEKYNSPDFVFLIEPSALRLTLPVNDRSLSLLDEKRKAMGRFAFLLQYPDLVRKQVTFKPRTVTVYDTEEETKVLANLKTGTSTIWTISNDCRSLCTLHETRSGSCFSVNTEACGGMPSEPNILRTFLSTRQLGLSFIVRKI